MKLIVCNQNGIRQRRCKMSVPADTGNQMKGLILKRAKKYTSRGFSIVLPSGILFEDSMKDYNKICGW